MNQKYKYIFLTNKNYTLTSNDDCFKEGVIIAVCKKSELPSKNGKVPMIT